MTQSRLAELSGIPDPTLSQIVNGRRAIDAEQVNRIAKALKRRPSYLWQQAERRLADEEDLP
ncbi:MAG: helix-turn-helix domain-containing protein [Micrococcales bacterium]|nr:helix-turn-helix domain-containing protein [Micrococcales bacterium]